MKDKIKRIGVIVLAAVALILLLFRELRKEKVQPIEVAENIGSFEFAVEVGTYSAIQFFYLYGDTFYLLLPAGTDRYKVCNLDEGDKVTFKDGVIHFYNASTDTEEEAEYEVIESQGIGSVFIDLEGESQDTLDNTRKLELPARIVALDENGKTTTCANLEYIRTRGNGSYNSAKKPYEIKFEESQSVFGMPKAKKWILLANSFDRSLVRNKLVFDFAKNYTSLEYPEGEYVDLWINGFYCGNYYICEKVEVEKNRVELSSLKGEDSKDITGGYLVDLVPAHFSEEGAYYFQTESGTRFEIKYPSEPSEAMTAYIKGIFDELEGAVKEEDGINPETGRHFSEIIDVESYVEKYLLETLFINTDSDYNSQYFYKDSDSIDGKLYAGPVWDYDMAMIGSMRPYEFNSYYLIDDLNKHEEVSKLISEKYKTVYRTYVEDHLEDSLKEIEDLLRVSHDMNNIRWDGIFEPYTYGYSSMQANSKYISGLLHDRILYTDNMLTGNETFYTVSFAGGKYAVRVPSGEKIGNIPVSEYNWIDIFAGWKDAETGEEVTEDTVVNRNMECEPIYIPLPDLLSKDYESILKTEYIENIDSDVLAKIALRIEEMQDGK